MRSYRSLYTEPNAQGWQKNQNTSVTPSECSSTISTNVYTMQFWTCQQICSCKCHNRKMYASRNQAHTLGSLLVGYTGPPLMQLISRKCTRRGCNRQSPPFLEVIYHFPLWFSSFALRVIVGIPWTGNPTFGLVLRKRHKDSGSFGQFTQALNGETDSLRSLLVSKDIHPNDVTETRGMTLLHVSFPDLLGEQ